MYRDTYPIDAPEQYMLEIAGNLGSFAFKDYTVFYLSFLLATMN